MIKKVLKQLLVTVTFVSGMMSVFAHDAQVGSGKQGSGSEIKFIENKGQWVKEARFKAEVPGGAMFLTDKGFVYNFYSEADLSRIHKLTCGSEVPENVDVSEEFVRYHAYRVNFIGSNEGVNYSTSEKAPFYHNYFMGNDSSKWVGNVGLYGRVTQHDIYKGVDLAVYSMGSTGLKYDFVVAPGADPAQILLAFDGVDPTLTKAGDLKLTTTVNEIIEKAPVSYQEINGERIPVKSAYILKEGQLSFVFPEGYDISQPLIIDPNLIFATFSGGTSSTFYAHSTTYDNDGNTYTAALAYGTGWPTTTGAYLLNYPGSNTPAINKYNPDGSALIFSTYFGAAGNGNPVPNTLRVNGNNELYMAGSVVNGSMPVTAGCFQATLSGGSDIYIVGFSADGSALIGSTFVGGSGLEACRVGLTAPYSGNTAQTNPINPTNLAFDEHGDLWVTSNSGSNDFPVTTNATQGTLAGNHDVVLFKMAPDLTSMTYGTYVGGSGWDGGVGLEYNEKNNTIGVVGYTNSTDFPTSSNAMHTTAPGGIDGFALVLDNTSYAIPASTYIGTSGEDIASRLAFDCSHNFFVAGRTEGNYPITAPNGSVPNGYVFIDKLTSDLSTSVASTRTGASNSSIVPAAMMVDICGNILVATIVNNSTQTGMPLTPDAFETNPRGFYFAAFEPNFQDLLFGSYYGATSNTDHFHPGVSRIDPNGIIYQSVCYVGDGTGWPTTPGSWSPAKQNSSTNDNVTFKFDFEATIVDLVGITGSGGRDTTPHAVRGCLPAYFEFERGGDLSEEMILRYELSGSADRGVDYAYVPDSLIFPPGVDTARLEIKPLLINGPGNPNPKEVIITVLSPCGCEDGTDNIIAIDTILIYDSLYVDIPTQPETVCANDEISITAEIDSTLNYSWEPAALIPDPIPFGLTIHPKPTQTTDYTITVTQPGAPSTCPPNSRTYRAVVEQYPQITMPSPDTTLCIMPGDSIDLVVLAAPAGVDYVYQWSPGDYLRDDFSGVNRFSAPTGEYLYHVNVSSPEAGCSAEDSMVIRVVPPFDIESVTPADTTIKLGDRIQLHAEGDAVGWLWIPVSYLDDPISPSPYSQPDENIVYQVIGVDQYGCRDTAMVKIDVEYETNNFIPSAFSPNGDGLNDFFNIANMRYERLLDFKVYNRYGQLVFESKDGKEGWDGTIDGTPAATDTYFYLIRVVVPFENEPRTFKGDITLIR